MSKDQQTKFKNNQMLLVILVCLSIALFSYAIPLNNNAHELDNIKNTLDMIHQIKRQKDKIYNDAYRKGYANYISQTNTHIPHCAEVVVTYNFHEDWNYVSL